MHVHDIKLLLQNFYLIQLLTYCLISFFVLIIEELHEALKVSVNTSIKCNIDFIVLNKAGDNIAIIQILNHVLYRYITHYPWLVMQRISVWLQLFSHQVSVIAITQTITYCIILLISCLLKIHCFLPLTNTNIGEKYRLLIIIVSNGNYFDTTLISITSSNSQPGIEQCWLLSNL